MTQKTKSMLIGIFAGALLGAAFAWVVSDGLEENEEGQTGLASLGPADYFQLGISILGLARQFGGMVRKS